jgi:hypothetical protein
MAEAQVARLRKFGTVTGWRGESTHRPLSSRSSERLFIAPPGRLRLGLMSLRFKRMAAGISRSSVRTYICSF